MPAKRNLIGKRFGRLSVLKEEGRSSNGAVLWECICECGEKCYPTSYNLKAGHTQSCGCLNTEKRNSRRGANHPNWKGGSRNRGSLAYAQSSLGSLKGHAIRGDYAPPDITAQEYHLMLQECLGVCQICGNEPKESLCLDHDHKTGRVRGLICRRCNHLLGCANDRTEILFNAMRYLEI